MPANDPSASSADARTRMKRQARADTKPELLVRKALHAAGLRYRLHYPVPGRPRRTIDIAFTRAKIAIFVDGCFWHRCPIHATEPSANGAWWAEKLAANEARDAETNAALQAAGWFVLRFWEHEDPVASAESVQRLVLERSAQRP